MPRVFTADVFPLDFYDVFALLVTTPMEQLCAALLSSGTALGAAQPFAWKLCSQGAVASGAKGVPTSEGGWLLAVLL